MLPATGNILDQLLGVLDTAQVPTVGTSPQAGNTDSLPFGNLLSMLVNGQGVLVEQPPVQIEQFLSKLGVPETGIDSGAPMINDGLTELVADNNAGWLEKQPVLEGELPQTVLPQRTATVVAPSFIANQNVRDLINSQPVELESAIYKVLDAGIKGDSLELTVTTGSNNDEPVKIKVPAEILTNKDAGSALAALRGDKAKSTVVTGAERVALTNIAAPVTENLDDLLAKMNLKAIEVKLEPAINPVQAEKQQVTLQMFGVVDGNQVVIKSKLQKQQIDMRADNKTAGPAAPKVSSATLEANTDKPAAEPVRTEPRPVERPVAVTVQDVRRQMPFNLAEKLTVNENLIPFETTSLQADGLTAKGEMQPHFDNATNPAPVAKMTLPQAFDKVLRPGGQSIMIKIEPEQLGPARLHLTMHNNVLTARVTVESAMARTAVEHSLNQLTDQLSRAGIEVDRIEVSLSDREPSEQFFHRRPDWAQPHNQGADRTEESFELEQVTPSPTLYITPTEFVRADGVNLLV